MDKHLFTDALSQGLPHFSNFNWMKNLQEKKKIVENYYFQENKRKSRS